MTLIVFIVSIVDNFIMDKEFLRKVASNIKFLRNEKKLTQEELACDAGVSRSTIGMLESLKTDITLSKIKQIANALEIEPYELLKFDKN